MRLFCTIMAKKVVVLPQITTLIALKGITVFEGYLNISQDFSTLSAYKTMYSCGGNVREASSKQLVCFSLARNQRSVQLTKSCL